NFENKFVAIDICDLSIRILELEKNGSIDKIRSFGMVNVPPGLIEDGRIVEKEKVTKIIQKAIKEVGPKKVSTNKVICSLPESKAFLRVINIPKVSEEEANEAVKWELEANIPLTTDQVYFDWQFLDELGGKQRILTVAVAREIVDDITQVLSAAGLEVYGLELESISCARSLIPQKVDNKEISIIVDIGSKKTSFIIVEGTTPYFTSSIPFSSQILSETIAGKLSVAREEAEKIGKGLEFSIENNAVFNVIKPLFESLAVEIEKTAEFYKSMSKEAQDIGHIILCGSGANIKGIIPYLATRLNIDIIFGDPWINLKFGNNLPVIDHDNSLGFSTAVGLAMKKIEYGD
ncbi:MAG TPA: type IV pilus assembly protein PilM, partial [Patescibacteria group bacterium]|nr:type IV pilus assembly protein PilM [Patescibacteria group bacterium]